MPQGATRIGDYTLQETPEGLEIRSIPDQHPNLNRLFGWLHPSLAKVGLPSVTLTPAQVLQRDSLGQETWWSSAEIARVVVQQRAKRGVEAKTQLLDRSWRVLILKQKGRPLRRSFGFGSESDARAFAAAISRALGAKPEDDGPPTTNTGA